MRLWLRPNMLWHTKWAKMGAFYADRPKDDLGYRQGDFEGKKGYFEGV